MKIKLTSKPLILLINHYGQLFNTRKERHKTYVGNRVWELHEDISRIALTLDRINMNPRYRNKRNVEKLIHQDILRKLWYMRKYQRYYRILVT